MAEHFDKDKFPEKLQGMTETDFNGIQDNMKKLAREARMKSLCLGEPVHALRDILALRSEDQLAWILDLYVQDDPSDEPDDVPEDGDRAAWIDAAYAALTDKAFIERLLYEANDEDWALFLCAVQEDSLPIDLDGDIDFLELQENGLLQGFNADGGCVVVADEIKEIVNALLQEGLMEKKAFVSLVNRYAQAAVNLYGIIPVTEFVELFNSFNKQKLTESAAYELLSMLEDTVWIYSVYEQMLVHIAFGEDDFEDVSFLAIESVTKPRYLPGKSKFLAYADDDVEWTPQLRALEQALGLALGEGGERRARLLAERVAVLLGNEKEVQDVVTILCEQGISFADGQKTLVRALKGVYNNTRLWSLKGHTRAEYDRWERERNVSGAADADWSAPDGPEKKKVGRNDPCPCGSGKKYKKCCGRDAAED